MPLNAHITVAFGAAGIDGATQDAVSHFTEALRKWLGYRGHETAFVWTLERSPRFGEHAHILAHLSRGIRLDAFKRRALGWVDGRAVNRTTVHVKRTGDAFSADLTKPLRGVIRYILKGIEDEETAALLGIDPSPEGTICGKRVGWSENIGVTARRRYWNARLGGIDDDTREAENLAC